MLCPQRLFSMVHNTRPPATARGSMADCSKLKQAETTRRKARAGQVVIMMARLGHLCHLLARHGILPISGSICTAFA